MQHPFDGIIPDTTNNTRRSWLKGLATVLTGLFAIRAARAAAPPVRVSFGAEPNPEPEGPPTNRPGDAGGPGQPSTRAAGEEGGMRPSTRAFGEEGGGRPTTKAVGEEGAGRPTTLALGEEGAGKPPVVPIPPPPGQATTLAVGEEG